MKKVLIFIGLKATEAIGVVCLLYGLYWLGHLVIKLGILPDLDPTPWFAFIGAGFLGICIVIIGGAFLFFIWLVIEANWRKAGELAKKP